MTRPESGQNPALLPAKTVIIGASGRMGKMLIEKGRQANLNIAGIDRPYDQKNISNKCADAELIIFCVPARNLSEALRIITPNLPQSAILADITSVKETPMRQMEEIWPGPVIGTHPLFGPHNLPDADLPVAIVPGVKASKEDVAKLTSFFIKLGFRVFKTTAEKHDQAMARIQNLNFITTLAYFAALAGQEDLLPFITPSFERRKSAAAKMLTEDAEMFAGLFEANGHSHEAAREYRRMLNLAAAGDIELLCDRARWWWSDKRDNKSLDKSDRNDRKIKN